MRISTRKKKTRKSTDLEMIVIGIEPEQKLLNEHFPKEKQKQKKTDTRRTPNVPSPVFSRLARISV